MGDFSPTAHFTRDEVLKYSANCVLFTLFFSAPDITSVTRVTMQFGTREQVGSM
jgi:hypothetical protein